MSKKLFAIVSVVLLASMMLAACAPAAPAAPAEPAPEESKLAVGIVLPTKDEPRWVQDETRFKDALSAAGYDVEILFSQGDSAKEKTNVESLITKGVKVIIICPQDGTAAAAAVEAARAAGVKVISYDRLIRDTDAVDYYVTFDSIAVGAAQAQYLVDNAKGTGLPLYLYAGAASDNNAFIFFEGAWGVLQPKIADGTFVIKNSAEAVALQDKATLTRDEMSKIISQITTNWDFNAAKSLAEANLTVATAADKGDVFILAPNDGTARAIADTFGADKDVSSYLVTGQDAEKASVQYIVDGKQSMTVFKDVRTLVADAITAAVALVKGETPVSKGSYNNGKIDVPAIQSAVVTVDKANVKAALIESGYYAESDFTGLDEAAMPEVPMIKACQVTDTGGIDDKSFNQTAWKGIEDAKAMYGNVEGKFLESQQQADYEVNINAFITEKCDIIIPVGFLLADATAAAAEANPDQKFAIIDVDYLAFPNLRGSGFAIDQATFLNGYLAAAMTKTGKVGTYVGIAFPATTKFMDGFALGVEYYNAQKGTDVQVLGWDYKTRQGLEVGNFESTDDGRKMGETLMDEGADIIMPVAGPVGAGTLAVMEERDFGMLIGVDNDWSLANPDKAKYVLSSAMKNMDLFVANTIGMVIDGTFKGENWIGTLDNGGVGLTYGSEVGASIPADLKAEIEALIPMIISGEIKTLPEGVY